MRSITLLTPAAIAASLLPAQTSHYVGPGGFQTLGAAINAAVHGDEVVIAPGSYPGVITGKSLTLRAEVPGTVSLSGGFGTIVFLISDVDARLVGIEFDRASIVGGNVSIEDCSFPSQGLELNGATAHLTRCAFGHAPTTLDFRGSLRCRDSYVSATDCTIAGANANAAGYGGFAIDLNNSTLLGSGLTLTTDTTAAVAATAVRFLTASTLRLTDSSLLSAPGICPIPFGDAACERCTTSSPCPLLLTEPTLGLTSTGALQAGATWTVTVTGEPNAPLLVLGSYGIARYDSPQLAQSLLLDAASAFLAGGMTTDALGQASLQWQLPSLPLPPGAAIWVQAVAGATMPLAVSPAAGGVVRP